MSKSQNSITDQSTLFALCGNAFSLIKSGKEKQAKEEFPMEYHFIKKYLPASIDELCSIFTTKLQLH